MHKAFDNDHELQVFAACAVCLGFGVLAELAGLSGAIGSFIAGIFIGRLTAFHWLEKTLHPFKVFFVAIFFVSIGLRLDLSFIAANLLLILGGLFLLLIFNSLITAIVFRSLRHSWAQSWYAAALLSQTGEFDTGLYCGFQTGYY